MKKSATDSFVLTMPFRYEPWQRDCLDKAFHIAGRSRNRPGKAGTGGIPGKTAIPSLRRG